MNDLNLLLDLPFATLFVIAVGYLGYRTAYVGRSAGRNAMDVLFLSAVFGLITKSVALVSQPHIGAGASYSLAAIATVCAALIWRKRAQEWLFHGLRKTGMNDHDGFSGVWESMLARPLPPVTQIVVRQKSGRHVMCDNVGRFNDAPLGPCLLGDDGSVALYVTHVRTDPVQGWCDMEPRSAEWGCAMTFIRSEEISDVEIRYET